MHDALGIGMVCMVAMMPFLFVLAVVWIKAHARNRELAQIMEERKLMIERGMEPPPLRLPSEDTKKRDPLANLKTGIILLAIATGLLAPMLLWPGTSFLGGHHLAQPAGVVLAILALGFIVIHFLGRAYGPKSGSDEATETPEEETP